MVSSILTTYNISAPSYDNKPNLRANKIILENFISTVTVACSPNVLLGHTAFIFAVNGILCSSRVGVEKLVIITEENVAPASAEDNRLIRMQHKAAKMVGILASGEEDYGSVVIAGNKKIHTFDAGKLKRLDVIELGNLKLWRRRAWEARYDRAWEISMLRLIVEGFSSWGFLSSSHSIDFTRKAPRSMFTDLG